MKSSQGSERARLLGLSQSYGLLTYRRPSHFQRPWCVNKAFPDMGELTKYDQIEPIYLPQSVVTYLFTPYIYMPIINHYSDLCEIRYEISVSYVVGFQVLSLLVMKNTIFWDKPCSPTQKIDAICSSETAVDFQQTARRYIPEVVIFITTAVRTSNPTGCSSMGSLYNNTFGDSRSSALPFLLRYRDQSTIPVFATYFHAGLLLGVFFDHKDGGDMLLRNAC
jgi:hypothetical protein